MIKVVKDVCQNYRESQDENFQNSACYVATAKVSRAPFPTHIA